MNIEQFIQNLKKLNIIISNKQLEQLKQYYELLIEWNEKINLTSITNKEEVYLKHFYDSLTINKVIDLNKNYNLCDIGTGAGFPGIVLKIIFPNLKITLIDSLLKRVNFLKYVISYLELEDIDAIHERAEVYSKKNIEKYDIVTSRAVAPLNILLEISIPLLKKKGFFIPMKGNIDEELKNSKSAIKTMNSKIVLIEKFNLPIENSNRTILLIIKENKTSSIYPRAYKNIKQKPL